MIVSAVLLLGAISLAQGYDKFFTIGPCTVTVQTDEKIDFQKVVKNNKNGIWSFMRIPDTDKYKDVEKMSVTFSETSENGKYLMTVYETQKGGEPQKQLPITLHDSGRGHATLDAKIDDKDVQMKMSVLSYEENEFFYYYLCSEFGGNIQQDYRFVLAHDELTKAQEDKVNHIEEQYGFKGELKKLKK